MRLVIAGPASGWLIQRILFPLEPNLGGGLQPPTVAVITDSSSTEASSSRFHPRQCRPAAWMAPVEHWVPAVGKPFEALRRRQIKNHAWFDACSSRSCLFYRSRGIQATTVRLFLRFHNLPENAGE